MKNTLVQIVGEFAFYIFITNFLFKFGKTLNRLINSFNLFPTQNTQQFIHFAFFIIKLNYKPLIYTYLSTALK